MVSDDKFADLFPAASEAQWRALVDAALKGAPFDRLVSASADGFRINPLYGPAAGVHAQRRKAGRWNILTRVDAPEFEAANAQALEDLAGGADGLHLVFNGSVSARGFGLPLPTKADLATLFRNIRLDYGIPVELDLSPHTRDAAPLIAGYIQDLGIAPNLINISFSLNPLGAIARTGGGQMPWPQLAPHFAAEVNGLRATGIAGPFVKPDGRIIHDAGGSEAQELAFVLACGLEYLRALEASGVALDEARALIGFRMAADADQFMSLAKFRALRRLWARVEDACGLTPQAIHIHAESAWRMMTRHDPWVNVLRTGMAAFAAGLGGADHISLLPFTQAIGLPDSFARRLARNTQLILLEESNLDKVVDPAAGAGGYEALTEELCTQAWALFQDIEAGGGLYAALSRGTFQAEVDRVRAERDKAVARRKFPLTGSSEFPNIHEASVAVLASMPAGRTVPPSAFPALPAHRLAEAFEALRDLAEAAAVRPKVFLANLGTVADFNARSMFARNFYEAGGIEALSNDGFADSDAMISAFRASGARLACLCSSDAVYAAEAVAAAKALHEAGAIVTFAGRPGELEAALKAAGVVQFIFAGCDVVDALKQALVRGGINP